MGIEKNAFAKSIATEQVSELPPLILENLRKMYFEEKFHSFKNVSKSLHWIKLVKYMIKIFCELFLIL